MPNIPDTMVEVGTRLQAQYGDKPIPVYCKRHYTSETNTKLFLAF
jgi:hypothetical protein